MDGVITDLPGYTDVQRRVLGVQVDGLRVLNLYVPNGAEVGSDKYRYKLEWLDHLAAFLRQRNRDDRLVVVGDFNIAPADEDVHDPELWRGSVLVSEAERSRFAKLLETGLHDSFRKFEQPADSYTWWDYRAGAFRRNNGLRIDHILCSRDMLDACRSCTVDREPRGEERPSDHAPVVAEFDV
jgi:exodeoxyribonuclease-3